MRKLTKALVLIVWNEVEGCRMDVPRLPRADFDEVFAIDGGSTDGTVEYLESRGIPVYRQRRRSLNAAYADAVDRAHSEAVVVVFPKGTIDPMIASELSRHLEAGYDLVIAGRNLPGAHNEEDEKLFRIRKWGVMVLSLVVALVWRREGRRVRDVLHGVKGFTVEAYRRMQISETGVTIDLEMVVRAYRLRLRRSEFPVREVSRPYGGTRFPVWSTGRRLAAFLFSELYRKL
jgi:glycosyltransferase involved in cell wall biosynthesis